MQDHPTPQPLTGEQLRLFELGLPDRVAVRLRDAHRRPLVGIRFGGGFRAWRVPAGRAWGGAFEYVQTADTGASYAAVALDCDDGRAAWEALDEGRVPGPSWAVWRTVEQGERRGHLIWALVVPVHHGGRAREGPLRLLARAAEWLAHATGADAGYSGLLSRCPTFRRGDLAVAWGRAEPYGLGELAEYIPAGWRRPRLPATAPGRNCAVFAGLRRWAYRPANWGASQERLEAEAGRLNGQHAARLPEREVRDIAKSVSRWMARRIESAQWTQETFGLLQAERGASGGRKSGAARRRKTALRDAAIVMARSETGASTRELAEQFGLDHSSVVRILQRAG